MAEALILSNFTVNNWQWDDQLGAYGAMAEKTFSLRVGETYRMVCNGVSYVPSAAQDVSAVLGAPAAAVGGLETIGLPGNGSTFIIGDIDVMGSNMFLHTGAAYGSPPGVCTFSLYRVGGGVDENGIQIKDRDGAPIIYEGVTGGINVLRADGTEALYVNAEGVPDPIEKTVELDFSKGDMVVTPAEGQVFSTVNIPVPENLRPEIIAKDEVVAGILGTMAAGGGSGNVKFGKFTTPSSVSTGMRISADIGFDPDFLIVLNTVDSHPNNSGRNYWGISSAFASANGYYGTNSCYRKISNTYSVVNYAEGIETEANPKYAITNANSTGFNLGQMAPVANREYYYFAIGGLT